MKTLLTISGLLVLSASTTCIKQSARYGIETGTSFSNEEELSDDSVRAMQFLAYQECNDASGVLESFAIIVADQNRENRQKMTLLGPDRGPSCPGFSFPSPLIFRAAIYAEGGRINGVRFQSEGGVTDIGLIQGSTELVYFNAKEKLLGFYGTHNDSYVTSLGFLSDDPICLARISEPYEGAIYREKITSINDDEDGSDAGLIVGICFAVLAAIGLAVGGFFLWRWYRGRKVLQTGGFSSAVSKVKIIPTEQPTETRVSPSTQIMSADRATNGEFSQGTLEEYPCHYGTKIPLKQSAENGPNDNADFQPAIFASQSKESLHKVDIESSADRSDNKTTRAAKHTLA